MPLPGVASQRQARFRGCGEALASPKNLRDGCTVSRLEPLNEEDTMVAIPKIIRVISCGFLLCLGLASNAVSAVDIMKAGHAGERIDGQAGLSDMEGMGK